MEKIGIIGNIKDDSTWNDGFLPAFFNGDLFFFVKLLKSFFC